MHIFNAIFWGLPSVLLISFDRLFSTAFRYLIFFTHKKFNEFDSRHTFYDVLRSRGMNTLKFMQIYSGCLFDMNIKRYKDGFLLHSD